MIYALPLGQVGLKLLGVPLGLGDNVLDVWTFSVLRLFGSIGGENRPRHRSPN